MKKMYHGFKQSIIGGIHTVDPEYDRFAIALLNEAQTILFSREQAELLLEASHVYTDTLEYKLPFECVFLQFSSPLPVTTKEGGTTELLCLMLVQNSESEEPDANTLNSVWGWYKEGSGVKAIPSIFAWNGKTQEIQLDFGDQEFDVMKAFAIACIGYINCENIYLHKEGEVPEKVNRKREREGKKILEPYYVCRIRGVQYDINGNPAGEGTHHGFRYDVRGHFRKMATDKTTWVRPHQRGLQHELYVTKDDGSIQ